MLVSELAKMVHENAVEHGWWEDEREVPEVLALIHSEWSEALEEARAGRPLVWFDIYDNDDDCGGGGRCSATVIEGVCSGRKGKCELNHKPEGVAVELIDGCIRILDYIGKLGVIEPGSEESDVVIEKLYTEKPFDDVESWEKLPVLVAHLHFHTSAVMKIKEEFPAGRVVQMLLTLSIAMSWVKKQGLDPLAILLEKHEYNKTRPYKHGKRF